MDSRAFSIKAISDFYGFSGKKLNRYYRNKDSEYQNWEHRHDASKGLLFAKNIGTHLSLDETSLSQGELYTVLSNKAAKGKKGTITAILQGTQSENIIPILERIPWHLRKKVEEVTLDFAPNMRMIVKRCFPYAKQVIDRFHVQQLAIEALQEIRIKHRWEAIEADNQALENAKREKRLHVPEILSNGDSLKQLLARSRYLLYKPEERWTLEQKNRSELLFAKYPDIQKAYILTQKLSWIYNTSPSKMYALTRLAKWHEEVAQAGFKAFNTISRTIELNYKYILNYFDNKSTNASAESLNAKIKNFRAQLRGVTDVNFFLFRLTKIYA